MSFVLMMIGILALALGAILIGFGIPINEFSLGNTLILAGTVTAMGGLVTFAVSRAVGQLSRIADLLASRPVGSGAAPLSAGPAVPPPPAPRAPQPRAQADEFERAEAVEPVRPPAPRAAAPAIEEAPAAPATPAARAGWRPPRPSAERPAKAAEPRRAPAAPGASDNPFDSTWPDKPAAPQRRESAIPAPPEAAPSGGRAEAVTVLKSGVVDGMAYTLYTDGSIEAELAQGVVRFGSIEELRNHLEKSS
jgi:hypothetical protein